MVESRRDLRGGAGRTERETRFSITSLTLPADRIGAMVRDHWAVETSLHWVMDMVFRDDECRLRTDHAPANFTIHARVSSQRRSTSDLCKKRGRSVETPANARAILRVAPAA